MFGDPLLDFLSGFPYIGVATGAFNKIYHVVRVACKVSLYLKLFARLWMAKRGTILDVVTLCTIKARERARVLATCYGSLYRC